METERWIRPRKIIYNEFYDHFNVQIDLVRWQLKRVWCYSKLPSLRRSIHCVGCRLRYKLDTHNFDNIFMNAIHLHIQIE